jgi:hypothetical protein
MKRFPGAVELRRQQIRGRHVEVHGQLALAPRILLLIAKELALALPFSTLAACISQPKVKPSVRVVPVLLFHLLDVAAMQVKKNKNEYDKRDTVIWSATAKLVATLGQILRNTEGNRQGQAVGADWFLAEIRIFSRASRVSCPWLYPRGRHLGQQHGGRFHCVSTFGFHDSLQAKTIPKAGLGSRFHSEGAKLGVLSTIIVPAQHEPLCSFSLPSRSEAANR